MDDRTDPPAHQAPEAGATGLTADRITTTTRDPEDLGRRLQTWLGGQLGAEATPEVVEVIKPQGNGMSSETLLFTARWTEDDDRVEQRLVARIEPELDKVPVFPAYDLRLQFDVIDLVGRTTDVAVPRVRWFEPDGSIVGAPFFVMDRVDGEVPRDVLPYCFPDPNWVLDATDDERRRLQDSAVRSLAGIHRLDPDHHDLSALAYDTPGATSLERHLAWWERYHRWVVADGEPSPLLAECMTWLRDHLPVEGSDTGPARLSWGDARIGNMLFADFEVAAVLDWEMAGIAPPEVDLGWMIYLHRFFQDLTESLGAEGLPAMLRPADVVATYREASGRDVGDLRWPIAYSAMRHGIIMRRVTERSILFGDAQRPDDVDDMILHRATLRSMLDGTYWAPIGL